MLVLTRKPGESIAIDDNIRLTISAIQGGRVKICIDAPRSRRVMRGEVADQIQKDQSQQTAQPPGYSSDHREERTPDLSLSASNKSADDSLHQDRKPEKV